MLHSPVDCGMGSDRLKNGSKVTDSLPQAEQRRLERCWPPKTVTTIDRFDCVRQNEIPSTPDVIRTGWNPRRLPCRRSHHLVVVPGEARRHLVRQVVVVLLPQRRLGPHLSTSIKADAINNTGALERLSVWSKMFHSIKKNEPNRLSISIKTDRKVSNTETW